MRIVVIHEVSNQTRYIEPPAGKNPVRIGSKADCDVLLAAGAVPPEAAQIINAGRGAGWELRTQCDRLLYQDRPLKTGAAIHLGEETVLYLYPFWITVTLDRQDREGDLLAVIQRADQNYAALVLQLHQLLLKDLESLAKDEASLDEESTSEQFLFRLEQAIEERAVTFPNFPADDLQPSSLVDHLAGIYCRTQAVSTLASRSQSAGVARVSRWSRLRTNRPDHDREAERLITKILHYLKLDRDGEQDPTRQIRQLDTHFWSFWTTNVSRIPLDLRRYLALAQLKKDIKDNWFGLGPLEDLLEDPTVTEIMVNDAEHIFIEKHGAIEESGRRFLKDLKDVIDRIVGRVNREINTSSPLVDARLPDGSRVNAVIAPLVVGGPSLTIRRFPQRPIDWDFLVSRGSLTLAAKEFLGASVRYRANILVSGGTASGKTTLLNALSLFLDDRERIVTIEDTAELRMLNRHIVRLESKPKNIEGTGEIPIRMLVKNALRMRPDRIIVGECRGGEALDMLQAMNTGHDGSMTTVHANSPRDVISRLEVMVQQGDGTQLPVASIHRQIVSAIDLVVQLAAEPIGDGKRRRVVREIAELVGMDQDGYIIIRPLFLRAEGGELRPTGRLPTFIASLVAQGFDLDHLKQLK